ncbi:MAG: biopolymer transporter ExbD [Ferruginibacter sp.]|nr:biopolymer transporter ExbD [Ferruginibacter sp.]
MAEITTENNKGNKRNFNKSTKVDLTPMVDLGFLLITFFVFTTTMSFTTSMGMVTPKDNTIVETHIPESTVITLIPAANNKLFYYQGKAKENLGITDYMHLRKLLVAKKKKVEASGKDVVLIIKPSKLSSFKNLVNIIDESKICMYKIYFIDKLSNEEELKIQF